MAAPARAGVPHPAPLARYSVSLIGRLRSRGRGPVGLQHAHTHLSMRWGSHVPSQKVCGGQHVCPQSSHTLKFHWFPQGSPSAFGHSHLREAGGGASALRWETRLLLKEWPPSVVLLAAAAPLLAAAAPLLEAAAPLLSAAAPPLVAIASTPA